MEFEIEQKKQLLPLVRIKVIGVGGGGGNTINSMVAAGCEGIEFIAANTDAQALNLSQAHQVVQLGVKSTKGLGAGANPDLGKRAAEEDLEKLMELVSDADIVFLTGGLGGGTGSGGLPVIARELKDKGILTIAVVTKPFEFEGKRRSHVADKSLELLKSCVDTLIVVPNQNLLAQVDATVSMIDAFAMINEVLKQSVKGISDIITRPGHINVDFADVKAILKDMGTAVIGTGIASGPDRALKAAQSAISSPLLENFDISGARSLLLNITGGKNMSLHEINAIASIMYEKADQDANIIIGSVIDPHIEHDILVTVIATGFYQLESVAHTSPAVLHQGMAQKEVKVSPMMAEERQPASKREPEIDMQNLSDLDIPSYLRKKNEI